MGNFRIENPIVPKLFQQIDQTLERAGVNADGAVEIEISIRGSSKQSVSFTATNVGELRQLAQLNMQA